MTDLLETRVTNRWIVGPNHANNLEVAHGGTVLKWMDEVGAMSAMRFAGQACVTARIEQVNFERPIPAGQVALIESYVYDAGRTSVRVRLQAFREDPRRTHRTRSARPALRGSGARSSPVRSVR